MSLSKTPLTLPINTDHVRLQFMRRTHKDEARFFYEEIQTRLLERLAPIRIEAKALLDAGCGLGLAYPALHAKFPEAQIVGVDFNPLAISYAQKNYSSKGWRQWFSRQRLPEWHLADLARTGLPAEGMDLVYSNLAHFWHPQPELVFAEWYRVTRPEGLCLFSSLGPGTFESLRNAMSQAEVNNFMMPFTDMHDLGDMLVNQGFSDPVMEQEIITLTYQTPERLLHDLSSLGGNAHRLRSRSLKSRSWYQQLINAIENMRKPDGQLYLELEVIYGHAWRSAVRRINSTETMISLQSIKRGKKLA